LDKHAENGSWEKKKKRLRIKEERNGERGKTRKIGLRAGNTNKRGSNGGEEKKAEEETREDTKTELDEIRF